MKLFIKNIGFWGFISIICCLYVFKQSIYLEKVSYQIRSICVIIGIFMIIFIFLSARKRSKADIKFEEEMNRLKVLDNINKKQIEKFRNYLDDQEEDT